LLYQLSYRGRAGEPVIAKRIAKARGQFHPKKVIGGGLLKDGFCRIKDGRRSSREWQALPAGAGVTGPPMYSKSQQYYDAVYGFKNYKAEAEKLCAHIDAHKTSEPATLLDVACGTGAHLPFLRQRFAVEGLDLDPGMIAVAQARNPEVPFHIGDMVGFDLQRQFDVVVSLFSAIAYAYPVARLHQAIAAMARHVVPGGLLIIEPFFTPGSWQSGPRVSSLFVDKPELKIARIGLPQREGTLARFDFQYLVGTLEGVEHFSERHELGLYEHDEYREGFAKLGIPVVYEQDWPTRRGLFIGVLPQ
jgi:SAM-dependent methyltransferase